MELEVLLNENNLQETIEPTASETTTFEVAVPMEGHTGVTLRNLVNMTYSKQVLIKKSLGLTANIVDDDFCTGINEAKTETLDDFKTATEGIGEDRCPGVKFDFNNCTITFKFSKVAPCKRKENVQLEIAVRTKPSQQSCTESCTVRGNACGEA